jgi:KDO2-lipid IV(A) lauroyltransferase
MDGVAEATLSGMPPIKRLAYLVEGAAAWLLFSILGLVPITWASAFGGWLGRTLGPRLAITRRARRSLSRALPDLTPAECDRAILAMWDNLGRVVAEYPSLPSIRVFAPDGPVEVVGLENVEAARAGGKQLIFVSAHFGNWELASLAATQYGLKIAQIYRAANNPIVNALIMRFRAMLDVEAIAKGPAGARRTVAALREGRHLALLIDQKMNDGIPVPFFGRDAMTAPAVAELALRYGAPIVPTKVERLAGARFRLTLYPAIEPDRTGDRRADVASTMARLNRIIEDWIRADPGQWFWLHRRWPD